MTSMLRIVRNARLFHRLTLLEAYSKVIHHAAPLASLHPVTLQRRNYRCAKDINSAPSKPRRVSVPETTAPSDQSSANTASNEAKARKA
ncbi:hypothetical protein TWF696_002076 [Orbilia brochopaga]|uniref:Uncharacterized protein n=1 Tax=Orbilia brochopaga TaxID=3140254 RepID=A0AAV9U7F9_9PEZI